jgi:hypothetical protein
MRKVLALFLSGYFLLITLGLSVDMHFCGDKLRKISFHYFHVEHLASNESCHHEKKCCEDSHNSCQMAYTSSCCDDVHQEIRFEEPVYPGPTPNYDLRAVSLFLLDQSIQSEEVVHLSKLNPHLAEFEHHYPPPYIAFHKIILYA